MPSDARRRELAAEAVPEPSNEYSDQSIRNDAVVFTEFRTRLLLTMSLAPEVVYFLVHRGQRLLRRKAQEILDNIDTMQDLLDDLDTPVSVTMPDTSELHVLAPLSLGDSGDPVYRNVQTKLGELQVVFGDLSTTTRGRNIARQQTSEALHIVAETLLGDVALLRTLATSLNTALTTFATVNWPEETLELQHAGLTSMLTKIDDDIVLGDADAALYRLTTYRALFERLDTPRTPSMARNTASTATPLNPVVSATVVGTRAFPLVPGTVVGDDETIKYSLDGGATVAQSMNAPFGGDWRARVRASSTQPQYNVTAAERYLYVRVVRPGTDYRYRLDISGGAPPAVRTIAQIVADFNASAAAIPAGAPQFGPAPVHAFASANNRMVIMHDVGVAPGNVEDTIVEVVEGIWTENIPPVTPHAVSSAAIDGFDSASAHDLLGFEVGQSGQGSMVSVEEFVDWFPAFEEDTQVVYEGTGTINGSLLLDTDGFLHAALNDVIETDKTERLRVASVLADPRATVTPAVRADVVAVTPQLTDVVYRVLRERVRLSSTNVTTTSRVRIIEDDADSIAGAVVLGMTGFGFTYGTTDGVVMQNVVGALAGDLLLGRTVLDVSESPSVTLGTDFRLSTPVDAVAVANGEVTLPEVANYVSAQAEWAVLLTATLDTSPISSDGPIPTESEIVEWETALTSLEAALSATATAITARPHGITEAILDEALALGYDRLRKALVECRFSDVDVMDEETATYSGMVDVAFRDILSSDLGGMDV